MISKLVSWLRRRPARPAPELAQLVHEELAPEAAGYEGFVVTREHRGGSVEVLFPTPAHITAGLHESGAEARRVFEQARSAAPYGVVTFTHNSVVRGVHS